MVQIQLKQKGKNRKLRIAKVRTKWESNILVADLFLTSGYTLIEFIHNIDWSKIVTNIQDALTNIQWIAIAEKILELLGYALGSITGALAKPDPPDCKGRKWKRQGQHVQCNRASKQKNIVRSRPGRGKSEKNGNWKKPV